MDIFPFASQTPPARHGRRLAALLVMIACGCFNDPKLDLGQTRHCQTDKSCPWGFVCAANGICCQSADGKTCSSPPAGGLDASGSPPVSDAATRDSGLGAAGAAGLDGAGGTGGTPGLDGSTSQSPDVPLDAPAISPEAGADSPGLGGIFGSGGNSTTAGAGGAGGASPIDGKGADVPDAPASGTGGRGGAGGAGGSGAPGQPCASATTCASGLTCSPDGHCCDRACTGSCESCESGTCAPVTGASHTGHTTCAGTTSDCAGNCTGAADGQCTWPTTACGQAACTTLTNTQSQPTGTNYVPQGSCTAGACVPGTTTSCAGGFVCASATACRTSCASDAHCLTGNTCSGGACIGKKANGSTCSGANECLNGNCVDGFCCESACTGTCMACAQAKTGTANGYCRSVTAGTDPDNECAVDTSNACGHDGTCDGTGACRYQSSNVTCGTTSCTGDGTYTPLGHCNGGGACMASPSGSCPNNMVCASSTTCTTTCSPLSTTGCPSGYKCTASGTSCVLATMPCAGTACPIANGGGECCFYNSAASGTTYAERCIPANGVNCAPYAPQNQYDDILCHSKADCPAGQICCLYIGSVVFGWSVRCALPTDSQCLNGQFNSAYQVCDPNLSPTECTTGSCTGAPLVDWGNPDVISCQ